MKRAIELVMLLLSWSIAAQDDPRIESVQLSGFPPDSQVVSYATVETETRTLLVTEIRTREGTAAFYLFDYVDHSLRARPVGPRSIPGDLKRPPVNQPITRAVDAPGDRFWPVETRMLDDQNQQLLAAPHLPGLRFMEIGETPWQLSPNPDSALAVRRVTVAADGTTLGECVLEPNITAVGDRMTTGGGWWVTPFGEPHLLVGMLHQARDKTDDYLAGLRLYTSEGEIVATTDPELEVDANAFPDLVRVDLSGDGEEELVFFSTSQQPSAGLRVYRFVRREGERRVLAFNLCSVRMNGPDVRLLQRALEGRGYSVGPHGLDGWYGPDTRAAVIRFQRAADLPVTGIVDDRLWGLLGL